MKIFCYLCNLCFVLCGFLLFGERGRMDAIVSRLAAQTEGGGTDQPERGAGRRCHPCHFSDTCREMGRAGQRGVRHPSVGFGEGVWHSSSASGERRRRPRHLTQPLYFAPLRVRHLWPAQHSRSVRERLSRVPRGPAAHVGHRARARARACSDPALPAPLPARPAPGRTRADPAWSRSLSRPPRREPHAAGPAPRGLWLAAHSGQ